MNKISSIENAKKIYFNKVFISYFLLIFFSIFNGLFEFTLENKWFYFAFVFEFFFLISSLFAYFLSLKGAISISFKENKKILLFNYIVYPSYIVLTLIYNYVYHLFFKGININFLYIIVFVFLLIFFMLYNYNYFRKEEFIKKRNDIEIINEMIIGINRKEYKLDDLKKMKNASIVFQYSLIFIFSIISLGILVKKFLQNDLAFILFESFGVIAFLALLTFFIIRNKKYDLFNFKFYILFTFYYLIFLIFFVLSAYMFNICYDSPRSVFGTLFWFMLFITGLFFNSVFKVIYPYYKQFFKLNIKEKEAKELKENDIQNEEIK